MPGSTAAITAQYPTQLIWIPSDLLSARQPSTMRVLEVLRQPFGWHSCFLSLNHVHSCAAIPADGFVSKEFGYAMYRTIYWDFIQQTIILLGSLS